MRRRPVLVGVRAAALLRPAAGAVLAGALVVGCTAAPHSGVVTGAATSSVPTIAPSLVLETGGPDGEAAVPRWDESSRAAAVQLSERAVAAWVNTGRGESAWRTGLASWLSRDAVEFYAAVDPRNIVSAKVTGPGRVTDDTSPYLATVEVPTSAGVYQITLNRVGPLDPWEVQRLRLAR